MIQLFRKIRHQLLSDHRFTRYVIYAFGEILLVVLGILIALQVNNWNENRKEAKREFALILEIKENILSTREAINEGLEGNNYNLSLIQYLADAVKKDEAYTVKMDTVFGYLPYWASPYLTETAYQNVKNTDINIISNPSLRKQITELHEYSYMLLKNDWDRWEWDINQSIVMPFFAQHIQGSMEDRYIASPNNYEALKRNEEFANMLSVLYRTRIYGINIMEDCLKKIDEVIAGINQEVGPNIK